jgi:heme/copper-type cytochrome/quinol oxidase subunit 3
MSPPREIYGEEFGESPEVHDRNLRIGVRVISGSTILFFFAFAFAYFYLRSVNSHDRWNAGDLAAPDAYGIVIAALFVLSAASMSVADTSSKRGRRWLAPTAIALAALLVAVVAQGVEYAHLEFTPDGGGFTSVFYGWTIFLGVFGLGAAYYVAVMLAEGARSGAATRQPQPVPGVEETAFYLRLLALIAVIAWVLLYLL